MTPELVTSNAYDCWSRWVDEWRGALEASGPELLDVLKATAYPQFVDQATEDLAVMAHAILTFFSTHIGDRHEGSRQATALVEAVLERACHLHDEELHADEVWP